MITFDPANPSGITYGLSAAGLSRFLSRACLAIGLSGEVEVLLSTDLVLRRLNKSFRRKNKSTDILSFPSPHEVSAIHAGDLAVSIETAARQAAAHGHSLRDEVRILLLHGLLHLSGLDHETDDGEMSVREAILRRELRLPTALIERAAKPASSRKNNSSSPAKPLRRQTALKRVLDSGVSAAKARDQNQAKKRGASR